MLFNGGWQHAPSLCCSYSTLQGVRKSSVGWEKSKGKRCDISMSVSSCERESDRETRVSLPLPKTSVLASLVLPLPPTSRAPTSQYSIEQRSYMDFNKFSVASEQCNVTTEFQLLLLQCICGKLPLGTPAISFS